MGLDDSVVGSLGTEGPETGLRPVSLLHARGASLNSCAPMLPMDPYVLPFAALPSSLAPLNKRITSLPTSLCGNDRPYSDPKFSLETLFERWDAGSWMNPSLVGTIVGFVVISTPFLPLPDLSPRWADGCGQFNLSWPYPFPREGKRPRSRPQSVECRCYHQIE